MLIPRRQEGVTLVELLIGMVIVSLLTAMGIPAFDMWIQNTQTRAAAESIIGGLQFARAEAARRNVNIRFNLSDANGRVAWSVDCVTVVANVCPVGIQSRSADEGGANARAGVAAAAGDFRAPLVAGTGMPAGVTFDGLGRVPTANIGADIARVDVTNDVRADARRMVIVIGTGGQIRMCDPALSISSNPQGCS